MDILQLIRNWGVCIVLVPIGVFFWFLTYVGAPIASKKSGKNVSGTPVIGGLIIAIGFLFSPCKILALLGFLDWQIFFLIKVIISEIFSKKDNDSHHKNE